METFCHILPAENNFTVPAAVNRLNLIRLYGLQRSDPVVCIQFLHDIIFEFLPRILMNSLLQFHCFEPFSHKREFPAPFDRLSMF